MTTDRISEMWAHMYDVACREAIHYRAAWLSAKRGRRKALDDLDTANDDCFYMSRRLLRALDHLDSATEIVIAIRAEHRLSAMAVDPHDGTTRYCSCGTRDCSTLAILQGRTDDA